MSKKNYRDECDVRMREYIRNNYKQITPSN